MRSVIEEIASAEQQAEEIRQNGVVQARDLTLKAKDDAMKAISKLENDARISLQAEVEAANKRGEQLSAELLEKMEREADAVCVAANAKLDQAVSYLLNKVTKTA